jgi:hypothetical protein
MASFPSCQGYVISLAPRANQRQPRPFLFVRHQNSVRIATTKHFLRWILATLATLAHREMFGPRFWLQPDEPHVRSAPAQAGDRWFVPSLSTRSRAVRTKTVVAEFGGITGGSAPTGRREMRPGVIHFLQPGQRGCGRRTTFWMPAMERLVTRCSDMLENSDWLKLAMVELTLHHSYRRRILRLPHNDTSDLASERTRGNSNPQFARRCRILFGLA